MEQTVILNKMIDFSGFDLVGNIWDNENTQLNQICKKGLVTLGHFNMKMLHVVSLICDTIERMACWVAIED